MFLLYGQFMSAELRLVMLDGVLEVVLPNVLCGISVLFSCKYRSCIDRGTLNCTQFDSYLSYCVAQNVIKVSGIISSHHRWGREKRKRSIIVLKSTVLRRERRCTALFRRNVECVLINSTKIDFDTHDANKREFKNKKTKEKRKKWVYE